MTERKIVLDDITRKCPACTSYVYLKPGQRSTKCPGGHLVDIHGELVVEERWWNRREHHMHSYPHRTGPGQRSLRIAGHTPATHAGCAVISAPVAAGM